MVLCLMVPALFALVLVDGWSVQEESANDCS